MNPGIVAALITATATIIGAFISKSAERTGKSSASSSIEQGAGMFFLIGWILACIAGETLGWIISEMFAGANLTIQNMIIGLSSGISQWYILQNKLRKSSWWILATASGYIAFGFLADQINSTEAMDDVSFLILSAIGGFIQATAQWFILQRQVHGAGYWVVTATVAYAISTIGADFFWYSTDNIAVAGLVSGLIYGLITAGLLAMLLNRPK